MIIDFHIHPFCKEADWGDIAHLAEKLLGSEGSARRSMEPLYRAMATKVSIEDYITLMNKIGIDKAVIVSFNITTAYGVCMVTNENIADFSNRYPNKFIGFACIDIPASDSAEQLEYAISSLELKGIKLVPPVQKFDISDKKYDPLWNKIQDYNIPLWTHAGHQVSIINSEAELGHPRLIDKLAMRHKDMTIIMGHMGTPWFWDAWSVVARHENVYIDISAHPDLYPWFPWDAFTKYNLEEKVIFASDHPICHWNKILPAIKKLPITESFKNKIFYQNALNILKDIL